MAGRNVDRNILTLCRELSRQKLSAARKLKAKSHNNKFSDEGIIIVGQGGPFCFLRANAMLPCFLKEVFYTFFFQKAFILQRKVNVLLQHAYYCKSQMF